MLTPRYTATWILLAASGLSFGCAVETETPDVQQNEIAGGGVVGGKTGVVGGATTAPLKSRDNLFNTGQPIVWGYAPDPTFPQKNLNVIGRTVTPRVKATTTQPAVPGGATFKLGWENSGSPSQVFIYRQAWILGATNTKEFTAGPQEQIASLGALPNGWQTWTDPTPVLNTRNCYFVKAGDGTYWSYSGWACGDAPNPQQPHAISKVQVRLRLSTAGSAVTSSNVRVRLNYGIPGSAAPEYTWLDAVDTPFYNPGGEQIFTLRSPGIRDLSDITMVRVEVPGNDGLCLNQLELIVDDARAFLKTSGSQECGNGAPFEWAWHSGLVDGTAVEIPFQELRNSSTWKNFSPQIFPNTITDDRPDGASFVGFTPDELRRKIDGITAHNLKEDGSFTGSSRRFRNGNSDVTSLTWVNENTLRVQQHVRLADSSIGCTVDAHPTFNLTIRPYNANHEPFDGTNGPVESTEITSDLLSSGIDQGGVCQIIPGIGPLIQFEAASEFGSQFRAAGATDAGKPPQDMRFCFPKLGSARLWPEFDNGGLSLCLGQ